MSRNCSVCTDLETPENCIVTCVVCDTKVHMLCYGVDTFEETWKCSPCSQGKLNRVCKLCVRAGGCMKQTVCNMWVHVVCALFTDGVVFIDNNRMEPVDISKVSNSKRNKTCVFCKTTDGFCCLCSKSKCKNRLHISCAKESDCLKELDQNDGKIKFRAYCPEHRPTESARRISALFVRGALDRIVSKNKKQQQEQSAQINSDWISQSGAEVVGLSKSTESHFSENAVHREPEKNQPKQSIETSDIDNSGQTNELEPIEQVEAIISDTGESIEKHSDEKVTHRKPKKKRSKHSHESSVLGRSNPRKKHRQDLSPEFIENNESLAWDFDGENLAGSSNEEEVILDHHICLKDAKIMKVKYLNYACFLVVCNKTTCLWSLFCFQCKDKIKILKEKNQKLEELNMNLQEHLLRLKQPVSWAQNDDSNANQDVLQILRKKAVPKLSDDEVRIFSSMNEKSRKCFRLLNYFNIFSTNCPFRRPITCIQTALKFQSS